MNESTDENVWFLRQGSLTWSSFVTCDILIVGVGFTKHICKYQSGTDISRGNMAVWKYFKCGCIVGVLLYNNINTVPCWRSDGAVQSERLQVISLYPSSAAGDLGEITAAAWVLGFGSKKLGSRYVPPKVGVGLSGRRLMKYTAEVWTQS